jgi:hypothetical protein
LTRARPEFAIDAAAIGVLLAIGVPALARGAFWIGGACLVVAFAVLVRLALRWRESLRSPRRADE